MAEAPYQSLYRRYRPQQFSELLGQQHVVLALRNAVRDHRTSHAYLFSGPRGTGKTSAARILAKALNCAHPADGEPDGTCDSCLRIQQGNSLDVHELDAASNNGVEAMRDLVSRAALGTPGRWKVYIVDEVHMLSTAASNALLKTLEEPPAHVVFVLATTDPQKVLPTIRSRTQHFEFRLLAPELLDQLVRQVKESAGLDVPDEALDLVVRRGRGSARDTLSVLDQVAAAGVVDDEQEVVDEIVEALCERDTGRALVALAEAMHHGRDPQRLAVELLEHLRNGFLALMARSVVALPDAAAAAVEAQARRLGAPALVRAMEGLGEALLQMRESPEPRVTLEVALVRQTKPELSIDPAALLERVERLERNARQNETGDGGRRPTDIAATGLPSPPPLPPSSSRPPTSAPSTDAGPAGSDRSGPATARATLGGLRGPTTAPPGTVSGPPPAQAATATALVDPPASTSSALPRTAPSEAEPQQSNSSAELPTRDELSQAWGDSILDQLSQRAKARFRSGRFLSVSNGRAQFALPNAIHVERCEEVRADVEAVIRNHFGRRVPLDLVVDGAATPPVTATELDDEYIDLRDTVDGGSVEVVTPEERLRQAFPGAEEIPQ